MYSSKRDEHWRRRSTIEWDGDNLQTGRGNELSLYHPTWGVPIYPTYKQVEHANESWFHVTSTQERAISGIFAGLDAVSFARVALPHGTPCADDLLIG